MKSVIADEYEISVDSIKLISDYCASVYFLCAGDKKYIFKLYRNFDTGIALQSLNIMGYLQKNSFPVASVVLSKKRHSSVSVFFPEGNRIGILFDYIEGVMGYDLDFESYAEEIGEKLAFMHSIMEKYDKHVIKYGKEHYIGRYINLMKEFNYSPGRTNELEEYGDILWNNIEKTKQGFCHGDLNPSNFIKANNEYVFFDFDCAGISYPINDIFTICSVTQTFACFEKIEFSKPKEKYFLLKKGYEKHRKLYEYDLSAMYSFAGVCCYWMAAQHDKYKSAIEGRNWLNENFFDKNYEWLMRWKEYCL